MAAVELHHRLIPTLVGVVEDRDRLLPDSVTSAVDPSDQDEAACDALSLNGHFAVSLLLSLAHLGYRTIGEHRRRLQWPYLHSPKTRDGAMSRVQSSSASSSASTRASPASLGAFSSDCSISPTPERCLEAFHLQRTRFEMAVERKLRRRQLTDDGNVEITGRDLRERDGRLVPRPAY
ncbi:MAG: hypothetical protein JO166_18280 [Deltaproteobacteria bacterium]|nr:hypothetical protein [Deltaproteobacteria bacterium]